ncbi:hypothetical protein [Paenibacillus alvei]|uniref:hypothetical protein n=1 Tax=Paenibacillus alvei TaxID=44250 RepID=UPI0018CE2172|nr:hypothetical protein [Paenibacillus alvei]MBG9735782.1 hypothetical protein [Paenibacillus alvei]MBG9744359.1 hypothetical protein [Paenibacillus alvei]MCY9577904.1 hypothetical protein [Paenibacillus alvei]MCY9587329.1 hypothetical protein [Paenibacillus alvei]
MAMAWGQCELFPKATKEEINETKFLLDKYTKMLSLIDDYEQFEKEMAQVAIDGEAARRIDSDDLHADKTANAVILNEKQRWVYQQYKYYTEMLMRGFRLIRDEEVKKAIDYRYIQGYSRKETILFFRHGLSDSTIDRRLEDGVESIANTLKLIGFFERETNY